MAAPVCIWKPQPGPQEALVSCPVFDVCYGGARGGGKTDGSLGDWAIHADEYGDVAKGIFFRRELTQLDDTIERSHQIYPALGAHWHDGGRERKTWKFANGATLRFRPLERDKDAEKYQGHAYSRVYLEELTNYPDPAPINRLRAIARSVHGVPVGIRSTCNPGGPGHLWVKARYIDPAPAGYQILTEETPGGPVERVFIPAKLTDNPLLLDADPGYVARLHLVGNEQLVKAWLFGLWDVIEGAYFDKWSDRNVLRPCVLPASWGRFRSFDWGSAKPFSVGWWAICGEDFRCQTMAGEVITVPRGALIRYAEWYGMKKGEPNVGLKMTAEQVAAGIIERERRHSVQPRLGYADPSIFTEDGGPSIAERMRPLTWLPADNKRVARHGAIGGWDQMRSRIEGMGGVPMVFCFSTCADSIRTIPAVQHDSHRAEDVDTEAEDHAADEWRYACMSRPRVKPKPKRVVIDRWDRAFKRHDGEGSDWKVA